jgi:F-type H+-transporting ATPase subunit gamma
LINIIVVLISSNRGLCGAFNTNIGKKAIRLVEEKYLEQANENNVKFFCFGKKSKDFIKKTKYPIIETNTDILNDLTYQNITDIANQLMLLFETEEFDKIELVYNSFKIASQSNLIDETYLPFTIEKEKSEFPTDYIFEPDLSHIKEVIIPDYLKTKLFSVFLDSIAAEHGARMTAMHQATDNATELVKELTLQYNKARQAAITTEILEITSGAEALNAG